MIGLLNVHSENSIKDSALLIPDILNRAKELGYDAVALTDQNSMTGIAEFINTAKQMDIKAVPGVELTVRDGDETGSVILLAKDYEGYVGICKAVSMANRTIENEIPILSFANLRRMFGKEGGYHGHIFASSAGADGILGKCACEQVLKRKESENAKHEIENLKILTADLPSLREENASLQAELDSLQAERKEVEKRTGKNFSKKEEYLEKLYGTDGYDEAYQKLEEEKADCRAAEASLKTITGRISRRKKKQSEIKKQITEKTEAEQKIYSLEQRISSIDESLKNQNSAYTKTLSMAKKYNELFGNGNYFIELMFHGLEEEMEAVSVLEKAAISTGIPTVISNDVHILNPTDEDVLKRRLIQSLKDNKWQEGLDCDYQYYMKSETDLANSMLGLISDDTIQSSLDNMHRIFDECSFAFPSGKHYPLYHDPKGRTSEKALEEEARSHIKDRFAESEWTKEYEDRLNYELDVICKSGYADYTMIISEILSRGKEGPMDGKPGYYIGPGRGSGVGSLVNYLMGITDLDPLKYGLIFERYLNTERISPPDIDSDIATSIRPLLVQYITQKYSNDNPEAVGVCSIVTKSRLTAKDAIRSAGRIVSSRMYGSASKLYYVADRISKAIPSKPNVTLDSCSEELKQFDDETEQEIIRYARLIENVLANYGTHAAGIIISDSCDVTDYAPVMNTGTNENPEWAIQYDKEESEHIGLLKLDALGLSTLDIITNTIQRIYNTKGIKIDMNKIPFEKQVFREIYGKGNTVGVFQCKSYGMQKLWKQMQPGCIDDIIAGIALYRPGPMDYIPQYIAGKQNADSIEYITPELEPILKDTYGTIVYQEQVMRIVRDLAGYSMGRSDLVRRAMAKKKQDIMDEERHNFIYGNAEEGIPGCIANGISEEKAAKVYDLMVDFAKYAFNKSHAAAYAVLSYQSAWLKFHYPLEFLIESMNVEKPENLPLFVEECRRCGFKVLSPDINHSQFGFDEYDHAVIYGLGNVKGVRNGANIILKNREDGGYTSFQDYLLRSGADSGATKALIKGGAFDSFCRSRKVLFFTYAKLAKPVSQAKTVRKRLEDKKNRLAIGDYKKAADQRRLEQSVKKDEETLSDIENRILNTAIPNNYQDSASDRLQQEKDVLFAYISEHPIDRYSDSLTDTVPISSVNDPGRVKVAGLVSGVHCFVSKRNQKEMAVFTLEDKTGSLKVFCGNEQFTTYRDLLNEDQVLKIYGRCKRDSDDSDSMILYMERAEVPYLKEPQTFFFARTLDEFNELCLEKVKPYITKQGSEAVLYEQNTGQLIPLGFRVNDMVAESSVHLAHPDHYIEGGKFFEPAEKQNDGD